MKSKNKKCWLIILTFLLCISLCACGQKESKSRQELHIPQTIGTELYHEKKVELEYAQEFSLDYYKSNSDNQEYLVISIAGDKSYLVLDQGQSVPENLPENLVVLQSPNQIYLVASQVMDMVVAVEGIEQVKYSALESEDWYIDAAREQMEKGELLYAGKYSAPDYELILDQGCDLAIENTMIYHSPEVKEKLESFGIPVIVDRSSYEKEPFGRMEWVKLYGALLGKEELAEKVFDEQVNRYEQIKIEEGEGPRIAFFYISANGSVKVRKGSDYVSKMISMAGGEYVFKNLGNEEENASSSVNMQMEEFYAAVKDADYLIYNSTIEGELETISDLLDKCELLEKTKAVQESHVYCTSQNLYQSSMETGTMIEDIHKMIRGEDTMEYLFLLK